MSTAAQPVTFQRVCDTSFRQQHWVPGIQILADLLTLEISLAAGTLLRIFFSTWFPIAFSWIRIQGIALGLLMVPCVYLLVGLYPGYGLSPVERLRRRVRANFFVFFGLVTWGYLVHRERWSRGALITAMLLALLLSPLVERMLIQILSKFNLWGASVVIFGQRQSGHAVAELMRVQRSVGYVPVAVLDVEDRHSWTGPALAEIARVRLRAAEIGMPRIAVIAMPALGEEQRRALFEALPFRCIIVMSDIADIQTQSITTVEIGGALGLALNRNLLVPWNRWLKRAIDVVAGSLLLLSSAPVIAFSALAIRLTGAGSPFYSQERAGAERRPIRVWMLRTMYPDADRLLEECLARDAQLREEWQSHFKLRHDPRVLPGIGRFLRRASIDELPQLWNVVQGSMSLVGPRPFPRYHLDQFDADFLRLRECVRPGLTGLWQVSSRSDGDLRVQQALDTYYIRNWSLWLDIEIAIRTVRAVIRGTGAY